MRMKTPNKTCSHMSGCGLFPLIRKTPLLALWQRKYCNADYESCARYQLSAKQVPVPPNLLPNGERLSK